jgi:hypothetical protein
MDAPLHPKPLYLPLRIVSRRRVQSVVVGLQIIGLALLAIALSRPFAGDWQSRASAEPVTFGLLIGVLLLMILGVGWMVAVSLLHLLPGSPLSHVLLTWSAIAVRGPFGTRTFAWTELGRFAVVTLPHDHEVTCIVASRPEDESAATDDRDRYRRAAFRLRSDPYCSPTEAEILARWLNEVRSAVAGRPPAEVAFFAPRALAANLVAEPELRRAADRARR